MYEEFWIIYMSSPSFYVISLFKLQQKTSDKSARAVRSNLRSRGTTMTSVLICNLVQRGEAKAL
jgi:hypothetical protein